MSANNYISFKLDDARASQLDALAAKKHISRSALIRRLLDIGLEHELASESVDYIREQLNAEIKATCFPQFERLAKLQAKIGYQSVSSFYLLSYIMDSILPVSKQQNFDETVQRSKAMAISYLKLQEKEFSSFVADENKSLDELDLK